MRERQNWRCDLCGGHHPAGGKGCISIHHKKPVSRRGSNDPGNLVGLCRGEGTCNCHDHVDYLTLEHNISYEQIMEDGVEYLLEQYPREQHFQAKGAPIHYQPTAD